MGTTLLSGDDQVLHVDVIRIPVGRPLQWLSAAWLDMRSGASLAVVTAEFALPEDHPASALLTEQGLQVDRALILRRQVGNDGRSRAFVNDQPISIALLRQLGDLLVEIEGQFEAHGLLDVSWL